LWGSLKNILEQQYVLSRKCNISPIDSNMLPDFEREVYTSLLMKDMEEERKSLDNK
jgi:hypothetical protein